MSSAPATFSSSERRSNSSRPSVLAVAPSATNTTEKPRTKQSEAMNTRRVAPAGAAAAPSFSLSSEMPETNER